MVREARKRWLVLRLEMSWTLVRREVAATEAVALRGNGERPPQAQQGFGSVGPTSFDERPRGLN